VRTEERVFRTSITVSFNAAYDDERNMFLQNANIHLQDNTLSQNRTTALKTSLLILRFSFMIKESK
jgi:hypothetical protein